MSTTECSPKIYPICPPENELKSKGLNPIICSLSVLPLPTEALLTVTSLSIGLDPKSQRNNI